MSPKFKIYIFFLLAGVSTALCDGKGAPDWLKKASEISIPPALLEDSPEVVYLHDEGVYEVEPDGTIVITTRQAMLILNSAGANEAVASMSYSEDTDKPLSIKAWMIPGKGKKGKAVEYKKKDIVDSVMEGANGSLVTTSRRRWIDGSGEAMKGWVFGFETVLRDKGVDPELFWQFQGAHPSVYSRLEVRLPDSWQYSTFFIHGSPLEGSRKGGSLVWEARNLLAAEAQPMGELSPLSVCVSLQAPSGERDPIAGSWEELALRFWPYYDSAEDVTGEMRAKVAELTAGIVDPIEQIRALCEYAQSINYVSIALELGKGGGRRPRAPEEVFASNYGDCKDKSNLLTALLAERGFKAYSLIVNWDDSMKEVREDWVSPNQFNHCIVAIEAPDGYESANLVEGEGLGRMLMFDPTNEYAVFGDLHDSLQGMKGMLLAGENSCLIELPLLPLETREIRREVDASIFLDRVEGQFVETSTGQQAAEERSFAFTDSDNYEKRVSRWLADSIPSVRVINIEWRDDRRRDRYSLSAEFGSAGYGKNLRNRTLIFKPILIGRYEALPFGDEERTQPVRLNASNLVESYDLELPEGFELSELPEDRSFAEDFGSYELRFEHDAESRVLRVEREVRILPEVVPLERFPDLEAFYRSRIRADQSVVVLEAI
ncbi:hypothetical protein VDG1235_2970 [Verrucomicrobiia bacterium DG1235]|nr:hypothetical protein VDG1235_2970 [Verrucomicrobiae bacterium DG1235]